MNDTYYTGKEFEILKNISEFCENNCNCNMNCLGKKCVLYRIENIITNNKKGGLDGGYI